MVARSMGMAVRMREANIFERFERYFRGKIDKTFLVN